MSEASSLLQEGSGWDVQQHTVVLVHGYGDGHDKLPMSILRDGKWKSAGAHFRGGGGD